MTVPDVELHQDLRSAVGELCRRFPDSYWRDLDREDLGVERTGSDSGGRLLVTARGKRVLVFTGYPVFVDHGFARETHRPVFE